MTDDSARNEENVTGGDELLAEELLVEEVSIDGMCGVY
jgi:mycofactocin precursor